MLRQAHRRKYLFAFAMLAACSMLVLSTPRAHTQTFLSFDAPGAGTAQGQGTYPVAINRSGLIVGYFVDASGVQHGFMRDPDGTFTIVDVPGSSGTQVLAVNSKGLVAGWSYPGDVGFLRYRNGAFDTLYVKPTSYVEPVAMNDIGQVAGNAGLSFPVSRGFIWSPGHSVIFTVPGAGSAVVVKGLNSSGTITGSYSDALKQRTGHAFLRDSAGNATSFDATDSAEGTVGTTINGSGQVAGWYLDASIGALPFLRDTDGTITLFTVGTGEAQATGINDGGVVVGIAYDATSENGFERDAAGNVTPLILPFGNVASTAVSINLSGRVVGTYYDSTSVVHGWLMTP